MLHLKKTALSATALLGLLALSALTARADAFGITLTGNSGSPSGTGTISTNGTCSLCADFGGGILSFLVNLGADTGAKAFDLADDAPVLIFSRPTLSLAGSTDIDSETADILMFTSATNWELVSGFNLYSGRYTISALVEPSAAVALAIMILGLMGSRARARSKLLR